VKRLLEVVHVTSVGLFLIERAHIEFLTCMHENNDYCYMI